ncbi:hypothetical protein QLX08_011376 [Tetragonisca angustula]|uniref:Uncharacterized protein n=1 Tax=Tetragonisca angustula TaxID=166442 RepID=A0AAW0Z9F1_9HYME
MGGGRYRGRKKDELFPKSRSSEHKSSGNHGDSSDPRDPKDRDNEEPRRVTRGANRWLSHSLRLPHSDIFQMYQGRRPGAKERIVPLSSASHQLGGGRYLTTRGIKRIKEGPESSTYPLREALDSDVIIGRG